MLILHHIHNSASVYPEAEIFPVKISTTFTPDLGEYILSDMHRIAADETLRECKNYQTNLSIGHATAEVSVIPREYYQLVLNINVFVGEQHADSNQSSDYCLEFIMPDRNQNFITINQHNLGLRSDINEVDICILLNSAIPA